MCGDFGELLEIYDGEFAVGALQTLMQSDASLETIADTAIVDDDLLEDLLKALAPESRDEDARYTAHRTLVLLGERYPERLYGRWDYFAGLLRAGRAHPKYNAVYILANLTRVDAEHRFEDVFRDYFDLLDDESVVVAAHTAANAGKITKYRPDLRHRITCELLNTGGSRLLSERRGLVNAYAIQAISEYFDGIEDRTEIVAFVRSQADSSSPKTRKIAKEFLRKVEA